MVKKSYNSQLVKRANFNPVPYILNFFLQQTKQGWDNNPENDKSRMQCKTIEVAIHIKWIHESVLVKWGQYNDILIIVRTINNSKFNSGAPSEAKHDRERAKVITNKIREQ